MKKVFFKLFATIMICTIISIVSISTKVEAANLSYEKLLNNTRNNSLMDSEEQIMMYDARTNETTVVDMEELEAVINQKYGYSRSKSNVIKIEPYNETKSLNANPDISKRSGRDDSADIVPSTKVDPYNRICRLEYNTSENEFYNGSAAIVGNPRIAITAAHCVFDSDTKEPYKNWKIQPGYSNGELSGTQTGWDKVYYSSNWMNTTDFHYDWAICVLQADASDYALGAYAYFENADMLDLPVTVYGYPGDTRYGYMEGSKYQYMSGDKITKVDDTMFEYTAYTVEGFSGGPVLRDSDNSIIGVHVTGEPEGGISYAVRFNTEMANIVLSLM